MYVLLRSRMQMAHSFFFFFELNHKTSERFLDSMGSKRGLLYSHPCTHMHTPEGTSVTGQEKVALV